MDIEEKDLIERAKKGDTGAFEELVKKYADKLYQFAFQLTQNSEDAKDILQEALMKAYLSIKSFHSRSLFSTWLYRILMNVQVDARRRKYKKGEKPEVPETEQSSLFPVQDMETVEQKHLVQKVLSGLSEELSALLVLRDIQNFTYEEISQITRMPLGTVKSRLARAREEFIRRWKEENPQLAEKRR